MTVPSGEPPPAEDSESIAVAVRIRPLLTNLGECQPVWSAREKELCFTGLEQQSWAFDSVLGPEASSQQVYQQCAQPLVTSTVLGGLNSVVFCYGGTGSGKTYTVGALTRLAAADVFKLVESAPDRDFLLRLSALEIYAEVVRDMLRPPEVSLPSNGSQSARNGVPDMGPGLKVYENPEGTCVEGLREEGVQSAAHLIDLLRVIESRRLVRDTKANVSSSRSHLIIRLTIERGSAQLPTSDASPLNTGCSTGSMAELAKRARPGSVVVSTISFVDLAGSERASQAAIEGGDGEREKLRQKEASSINRSLLTLGSVIRALGEPTTARKHVPYRDSRLTRILRPALAGNARMAIIVNISPTAAAADTTRAALHFANAAKRVLMMPKVNEVADEKAVIKRMQAEIDTLRLKLNASWLPGALEEKEEQVRRKDAEAAALQRRLHNLERLILRGPQTSSLGRRRSCDDSMDLAVLQVASSDAAARASACGSGTGELLNLAPSALEGLMRSNRGPRHPAAQVTRASWNPGTTPLHHLGPARTSSSPDPNNPGTPLVGRHSLTGRAQGGGGLRLLDFLAPMHNVRKVAPPSYLGLSTPVSASSTRARPPGVSPLPLSLMHRGGSASRSLLPSTPGTVEASQHTPGTGGGNPSKPPHHPSVPRLDLTRLAVQKLEPPRGQATEQALAALRVEVHCMSTVTAAVASNFTDDPTGASIVGLDAAVHHLEQEVHQLEQQAQQATDEAAIEASSRASLLDATRVEVARLRGLQAAKEKAGKALQSLASRLHGPTAAPTATASGGSGMSGSMGEGESQSAANPSFHALPSWMQQVFKAQDEDLMQHASPQQSFTDPQSGTSAPRPPTPSSAPAPSITAPTAPALAPQPPTPGSGAYPEGTTSPTEGLVTQPTQIAPSIITLSVATPLTARSTRYTPSAALSSSPIAYLTLTPAKEVDCDSDNDSCASSRGLEQDARSRKRRGDNSKGPADGRASLQVPHSDMAFGSKDATPRRQTKSAHGTPRGKGAALATDLEADAERLADQRAAPARPCTSDVSTQGGCQTSGVLRLDSKAARQVLVDQKAEVMAWYTSELTRMADEFRAANAGDVAALTDALEQFKEATERLEVQKRLLLHQVLKLEMDLEEQQEARAEMQERMQRLAVERDQARFDAMQAKAAARAAAAAAANVQAHAHQLEHDTRGDATSVSTDTPRPALSLFDQGDDGWHQDTPESLQPRILDLWHELAVPLAYRSRFLLGFKGEELFYWELEHRRLEWKVSQLAAGEGKKQLQHARGALDLERKTLAASLRSNTDTATREELFNQWHIHSASKERKLQLSMKVWHPDTLAQQGGAERSAELVAQLMGSDGTAHFMQLVFGATPGTVTAASKGGLRSAVGHLVQRIVPSTPRPRGPSPGLEGQAQTPAPQSIDSDATGLQHRGGGSMGGQERVSAQTSGLGAPRASGSGSAATGGLTPRRLSAMMSKLSQTFRRPGGAGSGVDTSILGQMEQQRQRP